MAKGSRFFEIKKLGNRSRRVAMTALRYIRTPGPDAPLLHLPLSVLP